MLLFSNLKQLHFYCATIALKCPRDFYKLSSYNVDILGALHPVVKLQINIAYTLKIKWPFN